MALFFNVHFLVFICLPCCCCSFSLKHFITFPWAINDNEYTGTPWPSRLSVDWQQRKGGAKAEKDSRTFILKALEDNPGHCCFNTHTHTHTHTHSYHTHSACTQRKRWQFCLELTRCLSLQWASSLLPWPTSPTSCSAVTCTNGSRWSLFQGWKERIPSSEMRWCSKMTQEVREQPTRCDRRPIVNRPGGTVEHKWC